VIREGFFEEVPLKLVDRFIVSFALVPVDPLFFLQQYLGNSGDHMNIYRINNSCTFKESKDS
jgi:hypothetical protein